MGVAKVRVRRARWQSEREAGRRLRRRKQLKLGGGIRAEAGGQCGQLVVAHVEMFEAI